MCGVGKLGAAVAGSGVPRGCRGFPPAAQMANRLRHAHRSVPCPASTRSAATGSRQRHRRAWGPTGPGRPSLHANPLLRAVGSLHHSGSAFQRNARRGFAPAFPSNVVVAAHQGQRPGTAQGGRSVGKWCANGFIVCASLVHAVPEASSTLPAGGKTSKGGFRCLR